MNWLAACILLVTLCIGVFFGQLYAYYYLEFDSIKHQEVLSYLLLIDNSGFIKTEGFTLLEKRHLLDVKRLLIDLQKIFILGMILSSTLFIFFRNKLKRLTHHTLFILFIFSSILLIFTLIDFFYFFKGLHPYFFTEGSWLFEKDSQLIILFPIVYFQQFIFIYMFILSSAFCLGVLSLSNSR
jgi:uncharacterized membrane protein